MVKYVSRSFEVEMVPVDIVISSHKRYSVYLLHCFEVGKVEVYIIPLHRLSVPTLSVLTVRTITLPTLSLF